jgi:hypothetical protein
MTIRRTKTTILLGKLGEACHSPRRSRRENKSSCALQRTYSRRPRSCSAGPARSLAGTRRMRSRCRCRACRRARRLQHARKPDPYLGPGRPAAGTARAGMTSAGPSAPGNEGEVCLGISKQRVSALGRRQSPAFDHLLPAATAIGPCPSQVTGAIWPRNRRVSGECRIKWGDAGMTSRIIGTPMSQRSNEFLRPFGAQIRPGSDAVLRGNFCDDYQVLSCPNRSVRRHGIKFCSERGRYRYSLHR